MACDGTYLTGVFGTPSLSASSSQTSPIPSWSASSCPELGTLMQLSCTAKIGKSDAYYQILSKARHVFFHFRNNFDAQRTNLFTTRVVARKIDVGPSVQIQIWSAYFAVSRPTHNALKRRIQSKIIPFQLKSCKR
jgi:hypothetical protein